jgi:Xaa-Pro aminopeptidase
MAFDSMPVCESVIWRAPHARLGRTAAPGDSFPSVLLSGEYRSRQAVVRGALSARGLDLLFVTSPESLCYLTGYEALWYPPRLALGAMLTAYDSELLVFNWSRHAAYIGTRVFCDECVLIDYADASTRIARVLAARGRQRVVIGPEWGSPSPAAPVMTSVANELRTVRCVAVR